MEGELSAGVVDAAIAVCAGLFDDAGVVVRRVIDLGCGPGVGSGRLAEAFPAASIVAASCTSQWPKSVAPISLASGSTRFFSASPW